MGVVAARINRRLRGTPMAGTGRYFEQAARRTGANPYQLLAIAGAETTFGKAGTGRPEAGYGAFGMGPGRRYSGYGPAIMDAARNLAKNYYPEGRRTLAKIGPKWVGSNQISEYLQTELGIIRSVGGKDGLVGMRSGGAGGRGRRRQAAVVAAMPPAPLPALQPSVTSRAGYVPMLPPTGAAVLSAPGLAGQAARYRDYQREQPLQAQRLAGVAAALTPPPVPAAPPSTPGAPRGGGGAGGAFTGGWPTGRKGAIIGTPYAGTHTLGNWQSDRAVDIGVPVGTPIVAVRDGVIARVDTSHHGDTGRFGGDSLYLNFPGDSVWYKHMSRVVVRSGQHVKKGQIIGYSGSANGTAHLHFASERHDPRNYLVGNPGVLPRRRRRKAAPSGRHSYAA